jgi:hypothetical protein
MTVAPYVFIVGLGVGSAALLQAGLHEGAMRFGDAVAVANARTAFYAGLDGGGDLIADYGAWLAVTEQEEWIVVAAIALAALLTWLVSLRVDVNVFSLNGMYANRLVRCYLGASVPDRKPNRFSGLSARDDLQLKVEPRSIGDVQMLVHPLADGLRAGGDPEGQSPVVYPGPYHLINTAINLVAGGNLAYQERKAGAFLLSPLYCGFQLDSSSSEGPQGTEIDAYRRTSKFSSEPRQLTLGEAVATSGAAASPNMGYHSTPPFAFLMGVFNIRLGRWVGNPHSSEGNENTWQKTGPKVALFHLLREVFGLTDKASGYVYLSDGGHFENLGIYELVRRRCRYIIACDAGADPRYGFEDLGNAIRKCRTDLGVEIDLDVRQIAATDALRYNGAPCAVGSICYSEGQVGTILYIKASRRAGVPSDVLHYASESVAFPHESTADQFFSESQFESYRRLGHFLAGEILGASRAPASSDLDMDRLFRDLSERWYRPSLGGASNFGRLAEEVDELFERLRTRCLGSGAGVLPPRAQPAGRECRRRHAADRRSAARAGERGSAAASVLLLQFDDSAHGERLRRAEPRDGLAASRQQRLDQRVQSLGVVRHVPSDLGRVGRDVRRALPRVLRAALESDARRGRSEAGALGSADQERARGRGLERSRAASNCRCICQRRRGRRRIAWSPRAPSDQERPAAHDVRGRLCRDAR